MIALRAALARWRGGRSGESGRGRRVERRQGNCSATCFSSRQAGFCPVNENLDKDLLKKKLKPPIRWMAAFRQASPWPRHPVSRQV